MTNSCVCEWKWKWKWMSWKAKIFQRLFHKSCGSNHRSEKIWTTFPLSALWWPTIGTKTWMSRNRECFNFMNCPPAAAEHTHNLIQRKMESGKGWKWLSEKGKAGWKLELGTQNHHKQKKSSRNRCCNDIRSVPRCCHRCWVERERKKLLSGPAGR